MDLSLLLQDRFGFQGFRPAQKQVIDKVMAGENVLAVMPTGSGKSLCYQLPALALPGLTVVVSPLIALMKDQVDQLSRLALPATVINSTVSREQQRSRLEQAIAGRIKLLFLAPERFQNDEFRARLAQARVSLFAVDEAHCISLWGHDFRPDYLRLRHVVPQLKSPPVLALTATATPAVRRDILAQLGVAHATQIVSGFDLEFRRGLGSCRSRDQSVRIAGAEEERVCVADDAEVGAQPSRSSTDAPLGDGC